MGKKKDIAKALKREREIEAELARRAEAKAAKKKSKKKGKRSKGEKLIEKMVVETVDAGALGVMTVEAEAPIVAVESEEPAPVIVTANDPALLAAKAALADLGKGDDRHPHLQHLDHVAKLIATAADETAKPKKRAKAEAELARLREEGRARLAERDAAAAKADEEIKARVAKKKAEREKLSKADLRAGIEAVADQVDRSDEDAVRAYNAEAVKVGATLLTSDAEREKIAARGGDTGARLESGIRVVDEALGETARHEVEEVETERGREFVAGSTDAEPDFAKPSDAEPELEEGRNGYKIIQLDADGNPDPRKVRQMTRVTTFVGNIDDETTLKKWEKRKVVEGLAIDALTDDREHTALIGTVGDIVHRRDVAISKATKADRKGKLGIGEAAQIIAKAEKLAKDELDKIVEEAAEIGGRNLKARAGTHLHTLAEISDEKGIDAVRKMHEEGATVHSDETGEEVPVTDSDLASIEAYAARMALLNAKVIESEAVIVNDTMGYAGRLDRIIMAKLPELVIGRGTPGEYVRPADQRARRYITDIKSGRIDLGGGKIGRQLSAYAIGDLYDPETGARSRHAAARDVALVFHLPQGQGVCTVHAVDLKAGTALLKLSAEVRRARNTGKKIIDTTVDIATAEPESEA